MNSRWVWNSHQKHKFLRCEAARAFSNLEYGNGVSRGFQEVFSTAEAMLFR